MTIQPSTNPVRKRNWPAIIAIGAFVLVALCCLPAGIVGGYLVARSVESTSVVEQLPLVEDQNTDSKLLDTDENSAPPGPTHGIPVTWSPLAKNTAAIVREIVWSADGGSAEVWVWYTHGMPNELVIGAAWDGQAGHVRDAWTSEDGKPWSTMAYETCKESRAVQAGGLGITKVIVHLGDGNGGFTTVPNVCKEQQP